MSRFDARAGCLRSELLSASFAPDGPDSEGLGAGNTGSGYSVPSLARPSVGLSEDVRSLDSSVEIPVCAMSRSSLS
jgi:hypothetical protein